MSNSVHDDDRFLRLPEVCHSVGLGKTSIYQGIEAGTFPRPVKYGRSTLWPESRIREWKKKLVEDADGRH